MFRNKFYLLIACLFTLFGVEQVKTQEPVDLEVVWQKEVFPKEIKFAYFSSDGQWIYAAIGNTIEKISAETGDFVSVFSTEGLVEGISEMDISILGNIIVTHDGKGAVNLWDTQLEKAIKYKSFKETNSGGAIAVSLSPDEKYLALDVTRRDSITQEMNSYFVFYDIINDKEIKRIPTGQDCRKIKFSHDGNFFATGGWYEYNDGLEEKYYDQVILWSTETWSPVDTIETLEGSGDGYRVIKFSKDDRYIIVKRITPYDSRVYDVDSKQIIKTSDYNRYCSTLEILPDNKHFLIAYATLSGDYSLELDNLNGHLMTYDIPVAQIQSFDNDGTWKIFCSAGRYPFSLLTNQLVGVDELFIRPPEIKVNFINNQIFVESRNIVQSSFNFEIYNLKGELVYSEIIYINSTDSIYKLDTELQSGFYICKIKADSQIFSQKIEIVR